MKERLLLLLYLLLPVAAFGEDYFYSATEDGVDLLYQVIDEDRKLCALGYYRESDRTAFPAIQTKGANPTELTIPQVVEGYTVVAVCQRAFYQNSPSDSKLERLTLPETVVLIGTNAFTNNAKLCEFHWPSALEEIGNNAFYGCAALENLDLPQSVKSIGRSAFSNCTGLGRVMLPSSLIDLWQSAFYKCENLRTVVVGNCPINYSDLWDSNVLDYVEELELHMTDIGYTNKTYDYLRTLILGDEVRTIGQSFAKAKQLASVTGGRNVESIGELAFWNCAQLVAYPFADGLKSIGDNAFYGCTKLRYAPLTKGSESIGKGAFCGCKSLVAFRLYPGVRVGTSAFYGCEQLSGDVLIPEGVEISHDTFEGCSRLRSITILSPGEALSFNGCSALETVKLGQRNGRVYTTFAGCGNLQRLILLGEMPGRYDFPAVWVGSVGKREGTHLYVPATALEAYKSGYASYMDSYGLADIQGGDPLAGYTELLHSEVYGEDGDLLLAASSLCKPGETVSQLPSVHRRAFCDYTYETRAQIVEGGENVLRATATWDLPFEVTTQADTTYYFLVTDKLALGAKTSSQAEVVLYAYSVLKDASGSIADIGNWKGTFPSAALLRWIICGDPYTGFTFSNVGLEEMETPCDMGLNSTEATANPYSVFNLDVPWIVRPSDAGGYLLNSPQGDLTARADGDTGAWLFSSWTAEGSPIQLMDAQAFADGSILTGATLPAPAGMIARGAAGIYDLQGRRVAQPGRGFYIVNGRKVLVR